MLKDSFSDYFKRCRNLANLLIFIYLFCGVSFSYYLLNFYMKYIPGNVYVNTIVASIAEAVSHFITLCLFKLLGARNSIITVNVVTGVATTVLWLAEVKGFIKEVPFFILLAKFGVVSFFTLMYLGTLVYFPSRYLGAVFGVCNTAARATTILAPMVAEINTPVPELCLISIAVVAVVLSRLLIIPKDMKGL